MAGPGTGTTATGDGHHRAGAGTAARGRTEEALDRAVETNTQGEDVQSLVIGAEPSEERIMLTEKRSGGVPDQRTETQDEGAQGQVTDIEKEEGDLFPEIGTKIPAFVPGPETENETAEDVSDPMADAETREEGAPGQGVGIAIGKSGTGRMIPMARVAGFMWRIVAKTRLRGIQAPRVVTVIQKSGNRGCKERWGLLQTRIAVIARVKRKGNVPMNAQIPTPAQVQVRDNICSSYMFCDFVV